MVSKSISESGLPSLDDELRVFDAIARVHEGHINKVRSQTERLAAEAAETTAEGIRDLVDEDSEVDSAAQAGLVRQASSRAMYSARRLRELAGRDTAVPFGHFTTDEGRIYVGRHSVVDGEDALLVDWRARLAVPFYRATWGESLGTLARRHFIFDQERDVPYHLVDYSDEIFDSDIGDRSLQLRGEAAVLAAVSSPTTGTMGSVASTIQASQDEALRAPADVPLVIQGGPGTGKTVVALHRAAYLLYENRVDLEDLGILVIGPTSAFLKYIERVIPSLGESGVVSTTCEQLYRTKLGYNDSELAAVTKGLQAMAKLLANYLKVRRRRPKVALKTWYGSSRVELSVEEVRRVFDSALSYQNHNDMAGAFYHQLSRELVQKVYSPSFDSKPELDRAFRKKPEFKAFAARHLPLLTAPQALNDLLGSKALLQASNRSTGLSTGQLQSLYRARSSYRDLETRQWSEADVPLLDELAFLLDGLVGDVDAERDIVRDAANEFEVSADGSGIAEEGVDLSSYGDSDDPVDPIAPSDFWKSPDHDMELYPIMYDQAEADGRSHE